MKTYKEFIQEARVPAVKKIGKDIGGELYVHKDYESTLPDQEGLSTAKALLSPEHRGNYNVVRHNKKKGTFAFIHSPDFDTADEPISGESHLVKPDGSVKITKQKVDPQIWHHKHQWVGPDYTGFDIEKSKKRSAAWIPIADKYKAEHPDEKNPYSKIGTASYWERNIVPHIPKDWDK